MAGRGSRTARPVLRRDAIAFVEWPEHADGRVAGRAGRAPRAARARGRRPAPDRGRPVSGVIVGIDTSTRATAVAVLVPGRAARSSAATIPRPSEQPRHAELLQPLLEQALAQAAVTWADVARICVGIGPGGFTGLRLGISTARALAQGHDLPVVGVSSLEALARGVELATPKELDLPGDPDVAGPVLAVIDARRGEVFAADLPPSPHDDGAGRDRAGRARRARGRAARVGTQPDAGRRRRGGTLQGGARTGRSGGAVRRFPRPSRQRPDGVPARTGEGARRPRRPAPGLPAASRTPYRRSPDDRPARRRHRRSAASRTPTCRRSSRSSAARSRRPWSLAMFVLELSKPTGICLAAEIPRAQASRARRLPDLLALRHGLARDERRRGPDPAPARDRHGDDPRRCSSASSATRSSRSRCAAPTPARSRSTSGFGFRSAGVRRRYYQDNGEDAIVMWRTPATLRGTLDDVPGT